MKRDTNKHRKGENMRKDEKRWKDEQMRKKWEKKANGRKKGTKWNKQKQDSAESDGISGEISGENHRSVRWNRVTAPARPWRDRLRISVLSGRSPSRPPPAVWRHPPGNARSKRSLKAGEHLGKSFINPGNAIYEWRKWMEMRDVTSKSPIATTWD